jgi:hypothetical protein
MISLRILFVFLAFFRGQFQQKKTGVGWRQVVRWQLGVSQGEVYSQAMLKSPDSLGNLSGSGGIEIGGKIAKERRKRISVVNFAPMADGEHKDGDRAVILFGR